MRIGYDKLKYMSEKKNNRTSLYSNNQSNDIITTFQNPGSVVATLKEPKLSTRIVRDTPSKESSKVVSVQSVNINPVSLSLVEGDKEVLSINVNPPNAKDKSVSFKSSNNQVASVNRCGIITAKTTGSCTIKVSTTDGSHIDECVILVTAIRPENSFHKTKKAPIPNISSGVSNTKEFSICPNPASDRINIQGLDNAHTLTLHTLTGQNVYKQNTKGLSEIVLIVSEYEKGTYIASILKHDGTKNTNLLIIK